MGRCALTVLGVALASLATAPSANAFTHPGVLLTTANLNFIKTKVAGNVSPWAGACNNASASVYGSLTYVPTPYATVDAADTAAINALIKDSQAAYTQALLWYIKGNTKYATNAIAIMNAWSNTFTTGFTGGAASQAGNAAAWAGSNFPRAAEIIRYTYTGWAAADITKFKNMLANKFKPMITAGKPYGFYGGNLNNSAAEAMINIGVFNDDTTAFNRGLTMWRACFPAYLYMTSDGALPAKPLNWTTAQYTAANMATYWYNAPLINGMCQETYRDLGHVRWGIAALCNGAETAYKQGVNLMAESSLGTLNATRLAAALELNAGYVTGPRPAGVTLGGATGVWEIGYNQLVNRRGMSLPKTNTYLISVRPTGASYFMNWETLTHYGLGN